MPANTSLQQTFLEHVTTKRVPVSVFLLTGTRLQGIVVGHDEYTLQLIFEGRAEVIYKRAISTIMPIGPIDLSEQRTAAT